MTIAIGIDIAASIHSNAAKHTGGIGQKRGLTPTVDLGQQARRERELVAAAWQR